METLPYSEPTTSKEAAESMKEKAPTLRQKVLEQYILAGPEGLTDWQVQHRLQMKGSTQRPRRWELEKMGLVEPTERMRVTGSGRKARVFRATIKAYSYE